MPTPRAMEVEESPERKAERLKDRTANSMPNLASMARYCPELLPSPVASLHKGGVRHIQGARAERPGLLTLADMAVNDLLPTPLTLSVRHSKRCQELRSAGDVPFHSRVNGETRPNGLEDRLEFNGLMPSQIKEGSMHSVTLARAVQSQDSKDGRASHLTPCLSGR